MGYNFSRFFSGLFLKGLVRFYNKIEILSMIILKTKGRRFLTSPLIFTQNQKSYSLIHITNCCYNDVFISNMLEITTTIQPIIEEIVLYITSFFNTAFRSHKNPTLTKVIPKRMVNHGFIAGL